MHRVKQDVQSPAECGQCRTECTKGRIGDAIGDRLIELLRRNRLHDVDSTLHAKDFDSRRRPA
ncbi:UNVERIFIED_CONTAM: hypothetical protein Sradi_5114200 [Sesamum radiatum]|uniref:Uncharacterized protein n=1 Tax=Sesamum radiatum TaxID=300843 RepID=A0AAW2M3P3_SESRA